MVRLGLALTLSLTQAVAGLGNGATCMGMADPNRLADGCIVEVVGYYGHGPSVSHGVLVYYPAFTELLSGYPTW